MTLNNFVHHGIGGVRSDAKQAATVAAHGGDARPPEAHYDDVTARGC